jgi:hypothetical protein
MKYRSGGLEFKDSVVKGCRQPQGSHPAALVIRNRKTPKHRSANHIASEDLEVPTTLHSHRTPAFRASSTVIENSFAGVLTMHPSWTQSLPALSAYRGRQSVSRSILGSPPQQTYWGTRRQYRVTQTRTCSSPFENFTLEYGSTDRLS